jgi:hypothetical protein
MTDVVGCYGEMQLFWNDLATAKLIAENMLGTDSAQSDTSHFTMSQLFPPASYNNNSHIVFFSIPGYLPAGQHYFQTFNSPICSAVFQVNNPTTFTGTSAGAIDRKIDDGNPVGGAVLATFEAGGGPPTTSTSPYGGFCVDATGIAYNQTRTTNQACELAFRF